MSNRASSAQAETATHASQPLGAGVGDGHDPGLAGAASDELTVDVGAAVAGAQDGDLEGCVGGGGHGLSWLVRGGQPFRAPAVMPRTNTPWTELNSRATGTVARIPPAISRFQ